MEALLVLLGLVYLVSPVILAVLWHRERTARRAQDELHDLAFRLVDERLDRLERRSVERGAPAEEAAASVAPAPIPPAPAAPVPTVEPFPPAPLPWRDDGEEPLPTVVVRPSAPASEVVAVPPPPTVPPPAPVPEATAVPAASDLPPPPPSPEVPIPTVPWTPPPPPPRAPAPPPAPPRSIDWESLVGVRLFSWMAGVTLLVAAVAFLRYSMEHGLLGAPVRMAIGLAVGVGLLVACETKRAQRYRPTALALTASGIATLFSTLYAAHALWQLLPALPTFALMALVTAVAVALSIRRDSVFIALLGLVGGFATPMLLSTGQDRPLGLFSCLAILDVGLAWVAYRKRWPLLSALSLGFTAVYQLGWVARFLEPEKLSIGAAIFLAFPLIGFGGLALGRRGRSLGDQERQFQLTAALGGVPPVLFAFHAASAGSYGDQWPLLFGFVFLMAVGLAIVAAFQGPEWLHLLGGAGMLAAVGGFVARSFVPEAWPGLLGFIALFVALYLGAPLLLARLGRDFTEDGKLGAWVAPLLLFVFPALAMTPEAAGPALFFLPLLLLAAPCAAFAIHRGVGPIHFLAAAAAVAAEAVWSGLHLAPERLLPALLAYGAFGLLFLGVPLLAERLGRPLRPAGSAAFLLLASLALLLFLAAGPVAHLAIWGIAALALLLEAGLLFEGARGGNPLLVLAGLILGFVVLVVWWVAAMAAALLVPALVAVGALALLALGGSLVVAQRREGESPEGAKRLGHGALVGLAGHAFLLAVVADSALALPPWPWLAVLFVLDLAFLVGALLRRDGALVAGAMVGSVLVLLSFGRRFGEEGAAVAAVAAVAVAAIGLAGFLLAPRRGADPQRFLPGAALGLFGAQAVLLVAGSRGWVDLALLLPAHGALLFGLLLLAWRSGAQLISLAAAASTFVAAGTARLPDPPDDGRMLALLAPLYLAQLSYPLLLGARARAERLPFAAAIAASAGFFLLAREAIVGLGGEAGIGLLPVAQAALLVPHLIRLLRLEAPFARDRGRLALMAGAILAFVTVAIPLQLERQWITLGWALEGAALAWLYRRIDHKGLLAWTGALFAAVFARLALNPSVFDYQPKSATPILNWYLYAYVVAAAACYAGAALLATTDDRLPRLPWLPRLSRLLPALGTVLLFLLVNIEVADFFSEGSRIVFRFSAGLAQDLTYTIAWALFAMLLLAAGVALRAKAARFAAIALLTATVLKGFLHDLAKLDGLYRVGSFVGLAMSLALVAIVLQRFVLRSADGAEPPPENP
jgi:uncharacterized membrane protein